jgi:hypothetical protein
MRDWFRQKKGEIVPVLEISRNGGPLCSVGSRDMWMFSGNVWADIWGPERSRLDVSGSSKAPPGGRSAFLIWHMPLALDAGDEITFALVPGENSSPRGKVLDPAADEDDTGDEPLALDAGLSAARIKKITARPADNQSVRWTVALRGGAPITVTPDVTRSCAALSFMWSEFSPEGVRVSLAKSSLQEIHARTPGEEMLQDALAVGDALRLSIG